MTQNLWKKFRERRSFKLLFFSVSLLAVLFSFIFIFFEKEKNGIFKIALPTPNLSTSNKTDSDPDNIIVPGQTITYTLSLNNTGGAAANGLTVTDKIRVRFGAPFNFTYSGCGSGHSEVFASPDLTISGVDVAATSTCVITYDVTLDNPINDDDPDHITLTNAAKISPKYGSGTMTSDTLTVDVTPDLSTSTKDDDDVDNDARRNQIITFTVRIKNTGDGTATGVNLDDILDSSLKDLVVSSLTNCGALYVDSSTANPPVVDINNLRINPGTNCKIIFTAKVKGGVADGTIINNTATIGVANEGGTGAGPSSDALTVLAPDLSTSTKADNDADNFIVPGQTVTYTLSVINSGGRAANNLTVTDLVDSHFGTPSNFVYTSCGASPSAGFTAPTLTLSNIDVAALTTCTIDYDVNLNNPIIDPAPESITIVNSADITPKHGSTTLTADTLTIDVTPDFSTSKKADDDADNFIASGQTITYTATLINSGDGTATGVNVDDAMDANLENLSVLSITSCGAGYTDLSTANPPVLDINNLLVNPGTNCIIVFTAKVKAGIGGGKSINNTITINAASEGGSGASPSSETLGTPSGRTCPAPSNISLKINNDTEKTESREVVLNLTYANVSEVILSEDPNFVGATFQPVAASIQFTLSEGAGEKNIYGLLRNYCAASQTVSDSIIYEIPVEEVEPPAEGSEEEQPSDGELPGAEPEMIGEPNPVCQEEIDCAKVTYDLYIVLPNGAERHSNSNYVRIEHLIDGSTIYKFEDRGVDVDYNDVIFRLDTQDCKNVIVKETGINARLHHRVGVKIFYAGIFKKDVLLWEDSQNAVGKTVSLDARSFVCAVQGSGVTIFENPDYGGKSKTFYVGEIINDLRVYLLDNAVSSLKIFGNAVVKLFDGVFGIGENEIFTASDPNLRDNNIGDNKISSLQVAAKEGNFAETNNENLCVSSVMFTEYLRQGSSGIQVMALQSLFKCLGYIPKDAVPVDYFSSVMTEAVKKFQQSNGLPVVGFVGPRTRDVLNAYVQ